MSYHPPMNDGRTLREQIEAGGSTIEAELDYQTDLQDALDAVAVKHGRDPVKMRVGLLGVALGAAIVEGATDAQIRAFCETTLRTLRSSQHMGELQAALEARRTRADS